MADSQHLVLPLADDLHCHLRQGAFMTQLAPFVREGGCGRVLVMPNLSPPVSTTDMAMQYKKELQAADPSVEYLMTLYLTPALTPEEIRKAKAAGVVGVKSYPRGVTTNSESGVESYEVYYPVFEAMQEEGLILNIHGEVPANHTTGGDVCVLNAEEKFLTHLEKLHNAFPHLRIVLEHVTTAAAVETVKRLGPTVAATVTAHHLELVVDDWAGRGHNFCKPVAKFPSDRSALREVVASGNPKFFLGSDSAPHPRKSKETHCAAAGVFTSPLLLPYLASLFDSIGCLDKLEDFTSRFGAQFYSLPRQTQTITLQRVPVTVPTSYLSHNAEGEDVVPFKANQVLDWSIAC